MQLRHVWKVGLDYLALRVVSKYEALQSVKFCLDLLLPAFTQNLQLKLGLCIFVFALERCLVLLIPIIIANIGQRFVQATDTKDNVNDMVPIFCLIGMYSVAKSIRGFNSGGGGAAAALLSTLRWTLWMEIDHAFKKEYKSKIFGQLQKLPLEWHTSQKSLGDTLNRLDRGINSLENLVSTLLFKIFPPVCDVFLALFYYSFSFDSRLITLIFMSVISYLLILALLSKQRLIRRKELQRASSAVREKSLRSLTHFETVKYCAAEEQELQGYEIALDVFHKKQTQVYQVNMWQSVKFHCLMGIYLFVALCSCISLSNGNGTLISKYEFLAFLTHISSLFSNISSLGESFVNVAATLTDINFLTLLLGDINHQETQSKMGALGNFNCRNGSQTFARSIEFRGVSFKHKNSSTWALKNVSFKVKSSETLGIVGKTGSGKTTIFKLLIGFYRPQEGSVLINDCDISNIESPHLCKLFGVVPQDCSLFNESFEYNIKYGGLLRDTQQVESAARMAKLHESILSTPKGYATLIGEKGGKLSSGEKQRLSIARAIAKDADMFLFDEPTSSLDVKTEGEINETLREICHGKTALIVSHKLLSVVDADQIIVIENGKLIEQGNHSTLIADNGIYSSMWGSQRIASNKSKSERG